MAIKEKTLERMYASIMGKSESAEMPESPRAKPAEIERVIHPLLWRILGWGAAHGFFVNSIYGYISGSVAFAPEEEVLEKHWEWIVVLDEKRADFLLECAKQLDLPAKKFETVWKRKTEKGEPVAVPLWLVKIDYWRLLDETGGDIWSDIILLGSSRYPLAPIGGAITANGTWAEVPSEKGKGKVKVLVFWAALEEARDFERILAFYDLKFTSADTTITLPVDYNDKLNELRGEEVEEIRVFYIRKRSANFIFKRIAEASKEAMEAIALVKRVVREGEEKKGEVKESEETRNA